MGVSSPVTVRQGVLAYTVTRRTALSPTIVEAPFSLPDGSPDREAVTGKSQMIWIDHTLGDKKSQELLLIELKNKGEWVFRH